MAKIITEPFTALGYGYQKHCLSIQEDENNIGCIDCPFHNLIVSDITGVSYICAFNRIAKMLTPEQQEQFRDGICAAQD